MTGKIKAAAEFRTTMPDQSANSETAFKSTGAVEQDRPEQKTNVAPLDAQLDHRNQDPLNKQSDSGMGAHGQTPEFSGEREGRNELNQDTRTNPKQKMDARSQRDNNTDSPEDNRDNPETEGEIENPGEAQKHNQGEKKDDDLAA